MDKKVILAAMAGLLGNSGLSISLARPSAQAPASMLGDFRPRSRGKGGAVPHHRSKRFVAMDKRDARKARNRARSR